MVRTNRIIYLLFSMFLLFLLSIYFPLSTLRASERVIDNMPRHISGNGNAAKEAAQHAFVIVLPLDNINWEDFANPKYRGFRLLMQKGSIGLMNANTKRGHERWSEYASLATGEPTRLTSPHWISIPERTYSNLPGQARDSSATIYVSNTLSKARANFGFSLGQLADYIRSCGYQTRYIGSQQTTDQVLDPAQLLVIGRDQIDQNKPYKASIDSRDRYTIPNSLAPLGRNDAIDRVALDVRRVLQSTTGGLLSIGLGDMERVLSEKNHLNPQQYQLYRENAVVEMDTLLTLLLQSLTPDSTLIVTGIPVDSKRSSSNDNLVPIAIVGKAFVAGGILSSETTHRNGFVANVDIVPTILSQLGILHSSTLGSPIVSEPIFQRTYQNKLGNLEYLDDLNQWNGWYTLHRQPWIVTFAVFVVLAFIFSLNTNLLQQHRQYANKNRLSVVGTSKLYMCIGLCLLPISFLLEASIIRHTRIDHYLQAIPSGMIHAFVLVLLFLVLPFPVIWLHSWINRLLYVSGLGTVSEIGLLLIHDGSFSQSFFGYDPVNGARYYGIGNEYMAGLVSFEMIVLACCLIKFGKRFTWLYGASAFLFVILLAAPDIGANMGGAVTAGVGNAMLLYRLHRGAWDKLGYFVCAGAAFVTILCIVGFHSIPSLSHTHASKILHWIAGANWHPISQILLQKINLNIRMLFVQPLWVMIGILFVGWFGWILSNQAWLKQETGTTPAVSHVIHSIIYTTLVGFLTNDSGLVVPVFMLYSPLCLAIAWVVTQESTVTIPSIKGTFRQWLAKSNSRSLDESK